MESAVIVLLDGLAYGMVLFIISVGLTVTMGLMRVVNLAHGSYRGRRSSLRPCLEPLPPVSSAGLPK
jgi:hypothetical protein